ncbi:hypothetical protein QBC35DRAFT_553987 [Podospora australis]|uniref:Glycoside Hydrolase Family 2 n=1 Tax=Podospora australis TaxID=1536484 RepID=A0AAN6WS47_9PEZI|nr:hypothetical protein QBC35DRAFT_553987 [Podospora australis]
MMALSAVVLLFTLLSTTVAYSYTTPLPSFSLPPASSRPKFRYWFPDASVSASAIASDISALANVSAGGLQFLPFFNQGFSQPTTTDWSTYGFGGAAYKRLLHEALRATDQHGLIFDFAMGPHTGDGVPAVPRTEGLAMELVYGHSFVTIRNGKITGNIPSPQLDFNKGFLSGWVHEPENWGASTLVAVVVGRVVKRTKKSGKGETIVFDEKTLVNLLNSTGVKDGEVDWQAPTGSTGEWAVVAFYERFANIRNCITTGPKQAAGNWISNGTWTVDHFSAAGAKRATEFWNKNLLDDAQIDALMRSVGGYSWEDSMEMMSPLWWTPGFLSRFEKARNYKGAAYLPVFFQAKNLWNSYGEPYENSFQLEGQPADGGKFAEDYRLTLSEGYEDYLREYQRWASSRGLQHSAQPAYNMPMDMSSTIPLVGAPELESLGFGESIEVYRQFTGPAHLFGRNAISTEIGAQRGGAYSQTIPTLLNLIRDSFAAGVNTLSIHGFPYNGAYTGTTWPGYTPFNCEFGEMWGPRQASWRHMNDTLLYAARNTEALKTGVPRVDLAFYAWKQPWTTRAVYSKPDLNVAGYTYEYLGPDNLSDPSVKVTNGVLAADGPAYKAIVLYGQNRITAEASLGLVRFAEAGLPVIIVGSATGFTTVGSRGQDTVANNMKKLSALPSVKVVTEAAFKPEVLWQSDINPRLTAEVLEGANDASQLYSHWRSDQSNGLELVYLLNRGPTTTFSIGFTTPESSVPYVLDAWTGEQTPLVTYLRTGSGISTRISLAQQQSTIVAFHTLSGATADANPPLYVVSHTNLRNLRLNQQGRIEGLVASPAEEASVLLSNNSEVVITPLDTVSATSWKPVTLGPWNLTVDAYSAPTGNLNAASLSSTVTRLAVSSPLAKLVPWNQIPSIGEKVSGIGYYRASFRLPGASTPDVETNCTIHLTGKISNTVRVKVNGEIIPAIDPSAPSEGRDITAFLNSGENEIVVEVASTLFNAVKARSGDLKSAGRGVQVPRYYTGPRLGFVDIITTSKLLCRNA